MSFGIKCARAAAVTAALIAASTMSASANEHFKGKSINVYIGYDAGGSYDFYGRMLARYMGPHLPASRSSCRKTCRRRRISRARVSIFCSAQGWHRHRHHDAADRHCRQAGHAGVQYEAANSTISGASRRASKSGLLAHVKSEDAGRCAPALRASVSDGAGSSAYDYWKILNTIGGAKLKIIGGYQSATPCCSPWSAARPKARSRRGTRSRSVAANCCATSSPISSSSSLRSGIPTSRMSLPSSKRDARRRPADPRALRERRRYRPRLHRTAGHEARHRRDTAARLDAMINDKQFLAEIEKTNAEFEPISGEKLQNSCNASIRFRRRCWSAPGRRANNSS